VSAGYLRKLVRVGQLSDVRLGPARVDALGRDRRLRVYVIAELESLLDVGQRSVNRTRAVPADGVCRVQPRPNKHNNQLEVDV